MGYVWTGLLGIGFFCALLTGTASGLTAGVLEGAQKGVNTLVTLAGSLCFWCGLGRLLETSGILRGLTVLLRPLLEGLFPEAKGNAALSDALSGNFCANLLGLGNAATPMGLEAAKQLANGETAGTGLCRLVVLNTASVQLIPTTVAGLRAGLGCETPFDILPAVWLTSLCSAGVGLAAAWLLERLWKK